MKISDNVMCDPLIFFFSVKSFGWIAMKFGSDIHVPLRLNCNNFDSLPFHVALTFGQNV